MKAEEIVKEQISLRTHDSENGSDDYFEIKKMLKNLGTTQKIYGNLIKIQKDIFNTILEAEIRFYGDTKSSRLFITGFPIEGFNKMQEEMRKLNYENGDIEYDNEGSFIATFKKM